MNLFHSSTLITGFLFATLWARGATITGPALTENEELVTNHGIRFRALVNTTLTGFTYNYQGAADTVVLTSSTGTILQSLEIPAGSGNPSAYAAIVGWSLTAGTTYRLLGLTSSNGRFAEATFPVSNGEISVLGGFFDTPTNRFWGDFSDINTGAVPEPSAFALTILGLVGCLLSRRLI